MFSFLFFLLFSKVMMCHAEPSTLLEDQIMSTDPYFIVKFRFSVKIVNDE